jgi:uncharacterized protein YbjT (DUF2867 family)
MARSATMIKISPQQAYRGDSVMKIVVIGGTGLIGSRVVGLLRQGAHQVIAASPMSGVNTVTGDGLPEALEGADVVVDVANSPSFDATPAWDFFFASGNNLMAVGKSAGVRHHIALSVVGTDRMLDSGYFRAKLLQEDLVRSSGLPYTILRSTQFFEFMTGIANSSTESQLVRLSPALVRPAAADDVAEALARIAVSLPLYRTAELAGPDEFRLCDVVGQVLAAHDDERLVIADRQAPYFGVQLNERTLLPQGQPSITPTGLDDWLSRSSRALSPQRQPERA